MALGPHVKEWRELAAALYELISRVGARNAFVADAWRGLWCRAWTEGGDEQATAFGLLERSLGTALPEIERLTVSLPPPDGHDGADSGWLA